MPKQKSLVVRTPLLSTPATASITVVVDTGYVAARSGENITAGIYMIDNMAARGSTGEGGMSLSTVVPVGTPVGFNIVPLNPLSGDTVIFTGFAISQGDVFGTTGYPMMQNSTGNYWVGLAANKGSQPYMAQISIRTGSARPFSYYVNLFPSITAV